MAKLILFDIDGTLLVTRGLGREATRRAMRDVFGTDEGVADFIFGGKTDWGILLELLGPHGYTRDSIGQRLPAYAQAMAHHTRALLASFPPIEACAGAIELVRQLDARDDVLVGIVTGNLWTTAPIKLTAAGYMPHWFKVGAYGGESPDRNDLPPIALARARYYSGRDWRPNEVVIIGDTPADVACARALGAIAVAVGTGFASREEVLASQPDFFCEDLTNFFDLGLL